MNQSHLRTDTQVQVQSSAVLRECRTPMHLPRLWTDAPVAKQTQVDSTGKDAKSRKGTPLLGSTGAKGAHQSEQGGQSRDWGRLIRQKGDKRCATQEGGGGERRGLCLTPLSVFQMMAFVCSESVIPAITNGKRDRVLCFFYCSQATYFVACGVKRSYIIIRYSFA